MREIQLGGRVAAGRVALVDDADFELVNQYAWCAVSISKNTLYASARINGRNVLMHRLLVGDFWPKVDHKDRNGLNNQRLNLRDGSDGKNEQNGPSQGGSSDYKGVSWDTTREKWLAGIKTDGHHVYLGRFDTEVEAAIAYNEAAIAAWGEYAYLNEIPELVVV